MAGLLSEGDLRGWLAERNRYFDLLSGRGLAGGKLRFRLARLELDRTAAA